MKNYSFTQEFSVRDYECDLQGIVNNAVYMNYLEHNRHSFLIKAGLDFADLHQRGIDAVVSRAEIDYKIPLKSGDAFTVGLNIYLKGRLRLIFEQEILKSDGSLAAKGKVTTAAVVNGRPQMPSEMLKALSPYFSD